MAADSGNAVVSHGLDVAMRGFPKPARPRAVDSAKVMQVIVTESLRGRGSGDDLCRIVTQYWSLGGELLAENDPADELSDREELIDD